MFLIFLCSRCQIWSCNSATALVFLVYKYILFFFFKFSIIVLPLFCRLFLASVPRHTNVDFFSSCSSKPHNLSPFSPTTLPLHYLTSQSFLYFFWSLVSFIWSLVSTAISFFSCLLFSPLSTVLGFFPHACSMFFTSSNSPTIFLSLHSFHPSSHSSPLLSPVSCTHLSSPHSSSSLLIICKSLFPALAHSNKKERNQFSVTQRSHCNLGGRGE